MSDSKSQFIVDYGYLMKFAFNTAKEASDFIALLASSQTVEADYDAGNYNYYFQDKTQQGTMIKAEVYESKLAKNEALKEILAEYERKNEIKKLEDKVKDLEKKTSCPPCFYRANETNCFNCGKPQVIPKESEI